MEKHSIICDFCHKEIIGENHTQFNLRSPYERSKNTIKTFDLCSHCGRVYNEIQRFYDYTVRKGEL